MRNQLFILKTDDDILAISEHFMDIAKYIEEFSIIPTKNIKKKYYIRKETTPCIINRFLIIYSDKYLHPFNSNIVLTDIEISKLSDIFRLMYENTKNMMSQLLLNNSMMNLTIEEKTLNTNLFEFYYSRIQSYESFLDSLDTKYILEQYIPNPFEYKISDII